MNGSAALIDARIFQRRIHTGCSRCVCGPFFVRARCACVTCCASESDAHCGLRLTSHQQRPHCHSTCQSVERDRRTTLKIYVEIGDLTDCRLVVHIEPYKRLVTELHAVSYMGKVTSWIRRSSWGRGWGHARVSSK
jgi:hypothetical protein